MARNMNQFVRLCRLIGSVLLLAVLGCATWNQTDVSTGHFSMRDASGTIRVCLKTGNRMEETIAPKYGPSRTIEGTWRLNGAYVEFTPFVDFSARSIVVHAKWRALANYDHNHNLQAFIDEDRGAHFERDHPFTLAALLTHTPALTQTSSGAFVDILTAARSPKHLRESNRLILAPFYHKSERHS
jgi:hypothetical protein